MVELTTRQQAARSGRGRRLNEAVAQQRALNAIGVQVPLDVLRALPRGAWIRFVPDDVPLRVMQFMRTE